MTYEVWMQQTLEFKTEVEAPNEKVALELARMEVKLGGVVVDEAATATVVAKEVSHV